MMDKASEGSLGRYAFWAAVLSMLCYAILRVGIGTVVEKSNPYAALAIAPDNALALVSSSTQATDTLAQNRLAEAAELARRAYEREPVSCGALRQLGLIAEAKGRSDVARRLLQQSDLLSRRDLLAQLMLIEDAVNRGDVASALRHYDVALRTSKHAASILFGPLTFATTDPAMLQPLANLLLQRPPWGNFYLLQAASTSTSPRNVANLMILLLRFNYQVAPLAIESLTGRLVQKKDFEPAWQLFSALVPAARRERVQDPQFRDTSAPELPFVWSFNISGSGTAVPTNDARGSRLAFAAPVGAGGVVARQMLLLPPGDYRLSTTVAENNAGSSSAPKWRLRCVDAAGDLANLSLPVVRSTANKVQTKVRVVNCSAQWLELVLTASDDSQGIAGAVSGVTIERSDQGGR